MALLIHVQDGAKPGNITRTQDISVALISDDFYGCKMRFLSPLSEGLPPFNPEMGPAAQFSEPRYVVLKITESEAGSPQFDKPGFYLVEGVDPGW